MIPGTSSALEEDLELEVLPSHDYQLHINNRKITGYVDELEAVKQTIFMILNTERYDYLIYSWDYGVELKDLYGEHVTFACPEIERRIKEALEMDERILNVHSFEFDLSKKRQVVTTFIIDTIFGNLENETVVNI